MVMIIHPTFQLFPPPQNLYVAYIGYFHIYKVVTFCVDDFHYHAVHASQIVDY